MSRIRILLADDHEMLCMLFTKFLEPKYEVVGSVPDGRTLIKAAFELKPDVVILDIGMPELNGISAGRELRKLLPSLKLVYLTMNKDCDLAVEALNAGASAYLLKNSRTSELLQAIEEVTRGSTYITPQISRALEDRSIRNPNVLDQPSHLTDRQREVLQLLAEGHEMKETAYILGISLRTVRFHKYRIMEELGISSDAELVQYAMQHGIIFPAEKIPST